MRSFFTVNLMLIHLLTVGVLATTAFSFLQPSFFGFLLSLMALPVTQLRRKEARTVTNQSYSREVWRIQG
jgi:hypothetical protein